MVSHDKFLNGRESRVFSREEKEVSVCGGAQSTKIAAFVDWVFIFFSLLGSAIFFRVGESPLQVPQLYLVEVAVYSL